MDAKQLVLLLNQEAGICSHTKSAAAKSSSLYNCYEFLLYYLIYVHIFLYID